MHATRTASHAHQGPKRQCRRRDAIWPLSSLPSSSSSSQICRRARAATVVVVAQAEKQDDSATSSSPPPLSVRLGAVASAALIFFSGVGVGAGGAFAVASGRLDDGGGGGGARQQQQQQQQQQRPPATTTTATLLATQDEAPSLSMPAPASDRQASAAAAAARARGLSAEEQATIRVFEEATPAVVNITNLRRVRLIGGGGRGASGGGGFYGSGGLYGGSGSGGGRRSASPGDSGNGDGAVALAPVGSGSGFLWPVAPGGGGGRRGVVVTNYHVVRGADAVTVTLSDQRTYGARVLGADAEKDVAVLQLEGLDAADAARLRTVALGASSDLQVGQRVYALGNPFGLDHSLSAGIVSGLNREIGADGGGGGGGEGGGPAVPLRGVIQTDASINPGNSGGVLLSSDGRVVGVNTAIADPTGKGASSGVGFALPIDAIKGLVSQILEYGRVVRPALGITVAPPQALRRLGLEGVLVLDAPDGGAAAKAGLRATERDPATGSVRLGDVIVGLGGARVGGFGDLYKALDERRVGDVVDVEVLRGVHVEASAAAAAGGAGPPSSSAAVVKGERATVVVRLGERAPAPALDAGDE